MTDTTTPATTLAATVDTHLAAYCEPDPVTRRALLDQVWVADGELLDPPLDGAGVEAIAELVDIVLAHYPAHRFERTTAVDEHHGFARYGWDLRAEDGSVAVNGIDVVKVDDTGRITQVVGFFGDLPAIEA